MAAEAGWAVCSRCGARVKRANLERHFSSKHPGEAVPEGLGEARRGWLVPLVYPMLFSMLCFVLVMLFTILFLLPRGAFAVNEQFWIIAVFALVVGVGLSAGK